MPHSFSQPDATVERDAMDEAIRGLLQTHATRIEFLESRQSYTQAQMAVDKFPNDLVTQACVELGTGVGRSEVRDILSQAHRYPFLALVLIEQELPRYLKKLAFIENEARISQANLTDLQHRVFQGPAEPSRSGPRP